MKKIQVSKYAALVVMAVALLGSVVGVSKAMFSAEDHDTRSAQVVSKNHSADKTAENGSVHLQGTVSAVDAGSLTVDGKTITLSASTKVEGSPAVGSLMVVEAVLQADGSLVAREVNVVAVLPSGTPEPTLTETPEATDDHSGTKTPEVENEDHSQDGTKTPEVENEDHKQDGTKTPEVENEDHHQDVTKTPEVENEDQHQDVTKTPEVKSDDQHQEVTKTPKPEDHPQATQTPKPADDNHGKPGKTVTPEPTKKHK